ncbi:hypothetical protein [Mycobacterium sp. IDR2000157661]|uniref:hypothetical protein n=1 Tax=Mycobacterium sp. IDR2000157661 TaxID=2867005 RepID=UPI001EEAFCA4|nr:hypothetical protein [Mycobacterium sp. IDR2000157661]ULE32522.1 hypothetical protein K3G64_20825 [Mycobacterium sp. IDR2000157661]
MTRTKRFWAAWMAAGVVVAVGTAGPASADEISANAVGTYDAVYPWDTTTWVVTPCEDDSVQCVHVTEYGAGDTAREYPGWSANAYWQVGWWMIQGVDTPNALTCEDGSQHNLPMNYVWDAATGSGVRSYYEPGICDGNAYNGFNELTVTRIAPATAPA